MSLLTSISTVAFHGNNRGAKVVAWLFHLYRTFIFDIIIEIRCNTFKIGHDTSKAVKCEGMNMRVCECFQNCQSTRVSFQFTCVWSVPWFEVVNFHTLNIKSEVLCSF